MTSQQNVQRRSAPQATSSMPARPRSLSLVLAIGGLLVAAAGEDQMSHGRTQKLDNPSLSGQVGPRLRKDRETEIDFGGSLEQPFEIAGQTGLRVDANDAAVRATTAALEARERSIVVEVRVAFIRAGGAAGAVQRGEKEVSRGKLVRIAAWVSLFMVLQSAAIWLFRARESSKRAARPFEMSHLDGREPMPRLAVERRDRTRVEIGPTGPRLVHFWATWCLPCRDEMPVFAKLASELGESGIEVVAVSVDGGWPAIEQFFDGSVPDFVVRAAEPDVLRQIGAGPLPDSFLVSSSGAMIARIRGSRDWSTAHDVIQDECSTRN